MGADNWDTCPRCKMVVETYREDYEIGIHNNEFYVHYKGSCKECGFVHEFHHEAKLKVEANDDQP